MSEIIYSNIQTKGEPPVGACCYHADTCCNLPPSGAYEITPFCLDQQAVSSCGAPYPCFDCTVTSTHFPGKLCSEVQCS
jgi:hypothetical protein